MARWLFKEEPEHYSFADLQRDGQTIWDGVSNALARQNLRKVRKGDTVFFYHTGKEKAIVGEMRVVSDPIVSPEEDDKSVAVEVAPIRAFARPVTLAQVKADEELADWDLVRLSRLSVMPVSPAQWKRVKEMERSSASE